VLPDGQYAMRGLVRDQYHTGQQSLVEQPLILAFVDAKPTLSDIVLLAKPAVRGAEANNFSRTGYTLTRAPGGLYARGADRLWLYAELYNVAPEQSLTLPYRLRQAKAKTDAPARSATVRGQAGRPALVLGELDLSKVPAGDYTLTLELRDPKKQLLTTQTAAVRRVTDAYVPVGAGPAR
jgi:hypothetical protein